MVGENTGYAVVRIKTNDLPHVIGVYPTEAKAYEVRAGVQYKGTKYVYVCETTVPSGAWDDEEEVA